MLLLVMVNLAADTYIYIQCRRRFRSLIPAKLQLFSAIALYLLLAVIVCLPYRSGSETLLTAVMWLLFGVGAEAVRARAHEVAHPSGRVCRMCAVHCNVVGRIGKPLLR